MLDVLRKIAQNIYPNSLIRLAIYSFLDKMVLFSVCALFAEICDVSLVKAVVVGATLDLVLTLLFIKLQMAMARKQYE